MSKREFPAKPEPSGPRIITREGEEYVKPGPRIITREGEEYVKLEQRGTIFDDLFEERSLSTQELYLACLRQILDNQLLQLQPGQNLQKTQSLLRQLDKRLAKRSSQ